MKKNILLLGDYIVDEFIEDLCEIDSDYKVSHIYVLNVTPRQEKIIKNNNIEVIKGWHDFTSMIHKDFNTDILSDPKLEKKAFNTIKSFYRFSDNQDFFYNETVYYELINYWVHFFKKNKISLVLCGHPTLYETVTKFVAEEVFDIKIVQRKAFSYNPENQSYLFYLYDRKINVSIPMKFDKSIKIKSILFPNYSKQKYRGYPKLVKELIRNILNFNISNLFLILSNLFNFFRIKKFSKKIFTTPDLNNNFIYYPLHFDPESSTMPNEEIIANQGLNIKKLAVNLPKGWVLYVKVHPHQFNFKFNFWPWEFYGNVLRYYFSIKHLKYINQIPNVILINNSISQNDLIKKSKSVASISGTVLLEASFYKKPILVFGRNLYLQFSNSYYIESKSQIKKAIKEIQKNNLIESDVETISQNYTYNSKTSNKTEVINQFMAFLANS